MDHKLLEALTCGALFLQLSQHAQREAFYSSDFLSKQDPSRVVKRLLDSMTLLLVPNDGGKFVTACSLDQRPVDQPANGAVLKHPERDDTAPATDAITGEGYQDQNLLPNLTLRIARNGPFEDIENLELRKLATKIINYKQTGGRFTT